MAVDLQVLGRAVKEAQYRHQRALEARLIAAGTTLAQWDALRAIGRTPGATARALAEETFQTEQAFGTLAGRLTSRGLIERTPGHGRRIEHRLTAEGERILAAGSREAEDVLADSFSVLTDEERATLLGLLHRLARRPDDGGTKGTRNGGRKG